MRIRVIAGFLVLIAGASFMTGCDEEANTERPVPQKQEEIIDTRTAEQKIAELPNHPRLYDDWKTTVEFYEKEDLSEKYVYVNNVSPQKLLDDALITYGDLSKKVSDITIHVDRIWGGIGVDEAMVHVKDYIPKGAENWALMEKQILTPKADNKDQTVYYWLRYSENGQRGWYTDNQYNITFVEKDGCITEALILHSPYHMFSDYRHAKNWVKSEWDTEGIF